MQTDFSLVETILADLSSLSRGEQKERAYRRTQTAPGEADLFDHVVALYENGFVEVRDTGEELRRDLVATGLSPDGKDLLDAMRNAALWEQVQQTSQGQGLPLDLATVKASVANCITGGFNA